MISINGMIDSVGAPFSSAHWWDCAQLDLKPASLLWPLQAKHEFYLYGSPRIPEEDVRDLVKVIRRVLGESISMATPLEAGRISAKVVHQHQARLDSIGDALCQAFECMSQVVGGKRNPNDMCPRVEAVEQVRPDLGPSRSHTKLRGVCRSRRLFCMLQLIGSIIKEATRSDIDFETLQDMESLGVILCSLGTMATLVRECFQSVSLLHTELYAPHDLLNVIEMQLFEAIDRKRSKRRVGEALKAVERPVREK